MTETLKGKIKAGDTVQIHQRTRDYAAPRQGNIVPLKDVVVEHTVTKVGRTLAYITEHGREVGFYLETGKERGEWANRRMYTKETLKAHLHRRDVFSAVSKATRDYNWADRLTTEALEDIRRILENPEARR
ncbi:hypothetical protein FDJ13_gp61 [Gordonia phage Gustav]|uniref:Uncharacterized protein n=1 Tax=Gordonia phage Gustav TaxID=2047872 RepID=A0A2H4PA54_9CAUD|nr:hypothetical protein FDJ13_gp61 [Gordonia phage Gustav]ATW59121.1 hypothetical protein PHIRE_GUSTAV_61 [Gordonia phage Gustav]